MYCLNVIVEDEVFQTVLSFFTFYRSYRDKTGKMRSFREAIRPLVPLSSLFILCTLWVLCSRNGIIDMEPRLYFVMCGTLFSNICVSKIAP